MNNNTIDFDLASKLWNKNKIKMNNGTYTYKCMGITKKNTECKKKPLFGCDYCIYHKK